MALTYTTDNTYAVANYNMSAIPQITPPNMTLIPNAQKPDVMSFLVPKTAGPMSAYSKIGYEMSVPKDTPLSALGPIPSSAQPSIESTPSEPAGVTNISYTMPSYNSAELDKFRAIWGSSGDDQKDYNRYVKMAGYAKMGSAALQGIGAVADAYQYTQLRREVEGTKDQYETQKKIIDTNIDKTESALMENLMSNMADLDVMSAAKNVDLSSQAIAGDKAKGAMDLGRDIADMRTNGALQKAALDLEYAMNVRKAKQQEINSYINAGLQIASTAISLL